MASLLGVTTRYVEQLVEQGQMPRWRKLGHRSLWHPEVFFSWLDAYLKSDQGDVGEVAPVRAVAVRPRKGKGADSCIQAQNAKRVARITMAANEVTSAARRAA